MCRGEEEKRAKGRGEKTVLVKEQPGRDAMEWDMKMR